MDAASHGGEQLRIAVAERSAGRLGGAQRWGGVSSAEAPVRRDVAAHSLECLGSPRISLGFPRIS